MSLSKKLGAEFIGTFWLVLGGCGSAVLAAAFPDVGIGLLGFHAPSDSRYSRWLMRLATSQAAI
ncbi:MAG: glycerol uptake facilitator-like aquaporin [Planctomycetota bacterium]|jgi:glycerol uptake facilitator-like aquaporin